MSRVAMPQHVTLERMQQQQQVQEQIVMSQLRVTSGIKLFELLLPLIPDPVVETPATDVRTMRDDAPAEPVLQPSALDTLFWKVQMAAKMSAEGSDELLINLGMMKRVDQAEVTMTSEEIEAKREALRKEMVSV